MQCNVSKQTVGNEEATLFGDKVLRIFDQKTGIESTYFKVAKKALDKYTGYNNRKITDIKLIDELGELYAINEGDYDADDAAHIKKGTVVCYRCFPDRIYLVYGFDPNYIEQLKKKYFATPVIVRKSPAKRSVSHRKSQAKRVSSTSPCYFTSIAMGTSIKYDPATGYYEGATNTGGYQKISGNVNTDSNKKRKALDKILSSTWARNTASYKAVSRTLISNSQR